MYELYNTKEKLYFLLCGLIIISCVVWVTHIAWKYDRVSTEWDKNFTTPEQFWKIEKNIN
jgi:hypothetical protein